MPHGMVATLGAGILAFGQTRRELVVVIVEGVGKALGGGTEGGVNPEASKGEKPHKNRDRHGESWGCGARFHRLGGVKGVDFHHISRQPFSLRTM